ncbi:hypothetical protein AGMMS49965_22240 [Bacteroidia bacterium]|nr:hypothetical protein AGMMS49965_22240 [Bacteroidia bacterium]
MFETIFSWFDSLFGDNLAEHLAGRGFSPEIGDYDYINTNLFDVCGIVGLVTATLLCVFFYYLWNPAYGKRWKWYLMLGTVAVINLIVGWAIPYTDLINENINVGEGLTVSGLDCFMFGFSDLIISAVFFFIISCIIKWGSTGNKYIPF